IYNTSNAQSNMYNLSLHDALPISIVFGIRLITMHYQTQNINVQTEEANKKLEKVKAKNADLKEQIKQLNNEDYLRKLIREKYSYSKDNEIIYNLPTDVTKNI